jgi:hypothetical protein
MGRWAVVDDATGDVVNVIAWDGVARWAPPVGCSAKELVQEEDVQKTEPGSKWDGVSGKFSRPDTNKKMGAQEKRERAVSIQQRIDALGKLNEADFPGALAEIATLQATLGDLAKA